MNLKRLVFAALISLAPFSAYAHGKHHHHRHHRHIRHHHAAHPLDIRSGAQINAERLVRVAESYVGRGNITGFHGPWCGAFAALVAHQAGAHVPHNYLLAKAWANAGRRLPGPRAGAVAVMNRRGGGHVGFVKNVVPGGVILVSGNSRGNRVAEAFYPLRRIIAWVGI